MFSYKTKNTCSREIQFDVDENDIVTYIKFVGGCTGNTQGIAKLATGRKVDDIITALKGTLCRAGTSCPDQLAQALMLYKEQQILNK